MSIQGKAVKKPILPAVFVVSIAWWTGFTIYEATRAPGWFFSNVGVFIGHALEMMLMIAFGIIAGAGVALFTAYVRRQDMNKALVGDSIRNLTTTMGAIPIVVAEPLRAPSVPIFSLHGEAGAKIDKWLLAMTKTAPAHAKLAETLFKIFNHAPLLPATHIPGGHGGKTLIQHSILVTQVMLEMASSWTYEGLKNKKGDVVLGLRNPVYKFNPNDPILGIIALGHDLGKMECYVKDKDGKVVGSRHAHDIVSAQMIARLPEFWAIPREDRDAITLSIAHYHHPQDLPLHEDGRAVDDRTIAAMELLIKADKAAGKIETGSTSVSANAGADGADADDAPAMSLVEDDVLYNAFIDILHEPGRINGKDSSFRVGQKHGGILYLAESSIRVALIKKLGMSNAPQLGDGRSALTVQLMELLSDRKMLMQDFAGRTYSFKRAMWRVAFFNSRSGKHLADWPAVLVVNPGVNMPQISSMKDHLSRVEITRPVWGESSAMGRASAPVEDSEPAIDGEDGAVMSEESSVPDEARLPSLPSLSLDDDESDAMEFGAPAAGGGDLLDDLLGGDAPAQESPKLVAGGDLTDDLLGDDVWGNEEHARTASEPAASVSDAPAAQYGGDEEEAPSIPEEEVPDIPAAEGGGSAPAESGDASVDDFNRLAKKLGGKSPMKGLEQRHLDKLGDKLQSGVDAALADLESKGSGSGRQYSHAMLRVEVEKLKELLKSGSLPLYSTGKGDLLALDELVVARARFDWDSAVTEAEAGKSDVFSVIRSGDRVFLRFATFQTEIPSKQ